MPTLAIIGRPNVGKSLLFNRLVRRDASLVHDRPGVTRDRVVADTRWGDRTVTVMDTGGVGLEDDSGFDEAIRREADLGMEAADVLLLVVDAREGVTPLDEEAARRIRRCGKPVLVVANKVDGVKQENFEAEFVALGLGPAFPVSAAHGRGLPELIRAIVARLLPKEESVPTPAKVRPAVTRVAIVGRPNVGKSSLVNAVLGEDRTIVSDIPGTTRDAVEIPVHGKSIEGGGRLVLIDTAGMRQRRRINDPLELAMTGRSAHAVDRADLVVLMITSDTGVTEQDKKIAGLIQKANKPCIIAVNKWDLAVEHELQRNDQIRAMGHKATKEMKDGFRGEFEAAIRRTLFFLTYAPVVFLSAKEKEGLVRLDTALRQISRSLHTPLPTGPLNRIVQRTLEQQPPPIRSGRRFKILYVAPQREEGAKPPKIVAFCNDRKLVPDAWIAFLEKSVRQQFALEGCPIQWVWKSRGDKATHVRSATPENGQETSGDAEVKIRRKRLPSPHRKRIAQKQRARR
jgi:GTP-binding protein